MPSKIGIITSDPVISAAIYREMITRFDSEGIVHWNQPDVALYGRSLPRNFSEREMITEGTEVIRKLGFSQVNVMPDFDLSRYSKEDILNRVPLLQPKLPIISDEMVKGIRDNIVSGTEPEDEGKRSQYGSFMGAVRQWADYLYETAFSSEALQGRAEYIDGGKKKAGISQEMLQKITDPARHKEGSIAFQGGMSSASGAEFFMDVGARSDTAVVLMSVPTTPNFVPGIIDMKQRGINYLAGGMEQGVVKRMRDTMSKLGSLNFDVMTTICNTAHYFYDAARDWSGITVHMPEEGIKAVPDGVNLLLLATDASLKGKVFERAKVTLGRQHDFNEHVPKEERQQPIVSRAIWDHLVRGDYEMGGKLLLEVIGAYDRIYSDLLVMAGCTEVALGLKAVGFSQEKLIDNAKLTADACIKTAKEAAVGRFAAKVRQVSASLTEGSAKRAIPEADRTKTPPRSGGGGGEITASL